MSLQCDGICLFCLSDPFQSYFKKIFIILNFQIFPNFVDEKCGSVLLFRQHLQSGSGIIVTKSAESSRNMKLI